LVLSRKDGSRGMLGYSLDLKAWRVVLLTFPC
jgi:hypothetical protein